MSPLNPIKELRNRLDLTQQDLANLAGISQQGVLRYEQSLYEEPSDKLVDTLCTELALRGLSPTNDPELGEYLGSWSTPTDLRNSIIRRYQENRLQIQQDAAYLFRYSHPVTRFANEHPFETWRAKVLDSRSRMRFCILLAVHPSVVAEYEKGKRRYIPRSLREAHSNAGVGNNLLTDLDYAGSIFYDDLKHRR